MCTKCKTTIERVVILRRSADTLPQSVELEKLCVSNTTIEAKIQQRTGHCRLELPNGRTLECRCARVGYGYSHPYDSNVLFPVSAS